MFINPTVADMLATLPPVERDELLALVGRAAAAGVPAEDGGSA